MPAAFDVGGPLPTGTTVLEASAGTGKTFTIAALATRYVAEGHATLDQLLLVTFGRSATQELRERVRERLRSAARGLSDPAAARAGGDEVLALLADVDDEEAGRRQRRLTAALAGFDAATIATTHQFAQRVLRGLGIAGDLDPDATFVESLDDLVVEVVDDLYVRRYGAPGAQQPPFGRDVALKVARAAVADGQARLEPSAALRDTDAGQRRGLAAAVRHEVERRKRARRLIGYDDLLTRLAAALADEHGGPGARQRLRDRYEVVLVDEFQDTDPVQWDILRLAFHGHTTLVLIGDPKQAIYAFRGADVVTYLDAAAVAQNHATLGVNWRSDQNLLRALEAVFRGAALGDPRIVVRAVASAHPENRLTAGGRPQTPLRIRAVPRRLLPEPPRGLPAVGTARDLVARDLAADAVRLLESDASLSTNPGTRDARTRPVSPGDVAVIVRTNRQAELVRAALRAVGVPAVLGGGPSVFVTPAAREWLVLLEALEQPHRSARVRSAALTCFLGWTAEQLATAGAEALDELGPLMRQWATLLGERGVAALLESASVHRQIPARVLACVDGERRLTDLRHVGQALHQAASAGPLGLPALTQWLRSRIREAGEDSAEERTRRLESDADAVQVITVHRSKGLEFPVVYLPFGWDRWVDTTPDHLLLHADQDQRVLDVGGPGDAGWDQRLEKHLAEDAGEELRLLYVAMTRAQSQVVAWWAPTNNTPASALHRLLVDAFEPGERPADSVRVPQRDSDAVSRLRAVAATAEPAIAVEVVDEPTGARWQQQPAPAQHLEVATFARSLDLAWRRTSYSGLTAAVHEQRGVGSEPEEQERDDEPSGAPVEPPASGATDDAEQHPLADVRSPMTDLPAGTTFGTLVHAVLEQVDTSAADLHAELVRASGEQLAYRPLAGVGANALADALLAVMDTPLGAVAGGLRLRDVAPQDRLPELDFELPLAGGDEVCADLRLTDVAAVLRRHLAPGDPLAAYPDLLDVPALGPQRLRGFLSGSIDAVLRLHTSAGPRYVIVDYKTNRLGPPGAELTAWDYRPTAMAAAMCGAHYPLQALLYGVALHRYLRWRQPGYDPDVHLGGVLYLFVRGMCGAATPVVDGSLVDGSLVDGSLVDGSVCGAFGWKPPPGLVADLSRLLDAGPP